MIPHDCLMMDLGVYEAGRTAEQEGFDAVVIDTMSDSGMAALRSVLSIPVIGPGKASMLYAQTLGAKFSVLAQWTPALPRSRKVIRDYGFQRQCASVRSFDVEPDLVNMTVGMDDAHFQSMLEVAMRCVRGDGAAIVCTGE